MADGPIIGVTLLLLAQVPPGMQSALSLGGGLFLLYLAATTAIQSQRAQLPRQAPAKLRGGLLKGFLARALSPHPYLFWGLVGAPIVLQAARDGWWSVAAFLLGYYGAIVGSNVGLAMALHAWMGRLSTRVYRWLLRIGSLILAAYGVLLLDRARR